MVGIGAASKLSGVGIETIRYYEREGIVPKPERAANGRRVYTDAEIGRLRVLRKCRDLGFSLLDSKILLGLSEQTNSDCAAVREMSQEHIRKIRHKIAELRALKSALEELTANCVSGNVRCPMMDRLRNQ